MVALIRVPEVVSKAVQETVLVHATLVVTKDVRNLVIMHAQEIVLNTVLVIVTKAAKVCVKEAVTQHVQVVVDHVKAHVQVYAV